MHRGELTRYKRQIQDRVRYEKKAIAIATPALGMPQSVTCIAHLQIFVKHRMRSGAQRSGVPHPSLVHPRHDGLRADEGIIRRARFGRLDWVSYQRNSTPARSQAYSHIRYIVALPVLRRHADTASNSRQRLQLPWGWLCRFLRLRFQRQNCRTCFHGYFT